MMQITSLQCAPSIDVGIRSDTEVRLRLPSGEALRTDRETLSILAAFASPRSVQQGLEEIGSRVSSMEDLARYSFRIEKLRKAGFLVAADKNAMVSSKDRFDSPPVHIRMLNDRVRTEVFQQAIRECVAQGDVVLDIGTGTGILAATAAMSGARHVYAVEQSSLADVAERVFAANGLSDRITVIRGHSTEISLPEQADLLVSEILGNDPLAEGILHVTADALDRHLTPNPKLIPFDVDVFAIPFSVPKEQLSRRLFTEDLTSKWREWYGIDFGPLVDTGRSQNHSFRLNSWEMQDWQPLSEPIKLASVDFRAGNIPRTPDLATIRTGITATADGFATGVLVYFETNLSDKTRMSIRPDAASRDNSWASHVWIPGTPIPLTNGARFDLAYSHGRSGSEFEFRLCK